MKLMKLVVLSILFFAQTSMAGRDIVVRDVVVNSSSFKREHSGSLKKIFVDGSIVSARSLPSSSRLTCFFKANFSNYGTVGSQKKLIEGQVLKVNNINFNRRSYHNSKKMLYLYQSVINFKMIGNYNRDTGHIRNMRITCVTPYSKKPQKVTIREFQVSFGNYLIF